KSEMEVSQLKMRLAAAGFRNEAAPTIYLGLKFLGLIVGLSLSGITLVSLSAYDQMSLTYAAVFGGGMFYLPDVVVWMIKRSRQESIFLGLPDALDLMVVCVEAGLGLDQAMRKVAEEMKKTYKVIADEFGLANFQLQVGRAKADVLHELGARTGVEELR